MDIFSSKDDQFLGRSSILPQQLKDDAGRLILTVFNKEMLPVGVIQCELKDTLPGCGRCKHTHSHVKVNTVYPEILAVIKFGDLPEIWPKCIIGGI